MQYLLPILFLAFVVYYFRGILRTSKDEPLNIKPDPEDICSEQSFKHLRLKK